MTTTRVSFRLGQTVITRAALAVLPQLEVLEALGRHTRGDWGEVPPEDARANDEALTDEGRLFSAYTASDGRRFWIITEADRSVTTVLLPEDY
jgi:hypothetical protein